jgi:sugar phosphate isomerase/epimerase
VRLGFFTACLPWLSLDDIAAWAATNGYDALEVAAWPAAGDRSFTTSHVDAAGIGRDGAEADRVRALFDRHGLELSSLGFYDNNLHPDPDVRTATHEHLRACIDAAAALGCPTVKLIIENCVMEGWHPDGYPGNLAYSPELWEWMFSLGLYLNYDPSHLIWMGIDPVTALRPYVDRIPHAQAKDIQLFGDRRDRYGWPGRAVERPDPWDVGWWRYRVPGLGEVDWRRLVDAMYEGGFDGVLSVEHEDPVWGGDEHRVKAGLEIAHRTLRPLLVR